MSKRTNYSQKDIKKMIELKGFTYISGSQINQESKHLVRCNSCKMIEEKSSRWVTSTKGCRFTPCTQKGKPTMLYMQKIAKDNDVTVTHPTLYIDLYNKEAITVTDKLIWKKDNKIMTQSFEEIRKRAFSTKKGDFFISDKDRIFPIKGKMDLKNIEEVIKKLQKRLIVKELKTSVAKHSLFLHTPCNKEISLTHKQLVNFQDTQCIVCNPIDQKAITNFNLYLKDKNMKFNGKLKLKNNSTDVDRHQSISIECLLCGSNNQSAIYDRVRYRGFTYCENDNCSNTRHPKDITNQSVDYYLNLFKQYHFTSMAEIQQAFPNAAQYIQSNKTKRDKIVKILGFRTNALTQDFTDDELISSLKIAYNSGFQKKDKLMNSLPNEIKNFINRNNRNSAFQIKLNIFLEEVGVILLKNIDINNLEDALNYIDNYVIKSWSELLNQHNSVSNKIIDLNLKDDIFKIKCWIKLPNYSNLTDNELLAEVNNICVDNTIKTISDLRNKSYNLVNYLNKRGLTKQVIQTHNFPELMNWQDYSKQEVIDYIKNKKYFSLSDIHLEESGLYKHCSKNDWLRDIEKECKLGNFRGLDGQSYGSRVELIIANILNIGNIQYETHKNIFKGAKGGQSKSDFYLKDYDFHIEVWGLDKGQDAHKSNMPNYLEIREYKEGQYKQHNITLCSIEGNLYYKSIIIDNVQHTHKLEGYIAHAINQLNKHKVKIINNENLVKQVRFSIKSD